MIFEITIGGCVLALLVGAIAHKKALIVWPTLLVIGNIVYLIMTINTDALWIIGQIVLAGISLLTLPAMGLGIAIRDHWSGDQRDSKPN